MQLSASKNSSSFISPERTFSDICQTPVPEPMIVTLKFSGQHGPAGKADGGQIAGGGAHQQGRSGLVATHEQNDAVTGIAADGFLDVHAGEIAEEHRRGTQQHLAEGHHRKFQRKAACFPDAALYPFGDFAEVRVAGREFGPGVADADDRTAGEHVVRPALIFHPATIDETVAVFSAEPFLAAQFFCGHGWRSPRRLWRKQIECGSPPPDENVYLGVAGAPSKTLLDCRAFAETFGRDCREQRHRCSAVCQSFPSETKRCNDIAKRIARDGDMN